MLGPSRRALLILAAFSLLLAACNSSRPPATEPTAPAIQATEAASPPTVQTTPTPTVAAGSAATPVVRVGNEPVAVEAEDGTVVRGHLYEPTGPRRKVVVLAHAANSTQEEWTGFAQELARQGIAALTFDFRGHGETGGTRDMPNITRDLDAAVRFMKSRDYAQVYVIGAEIGATAALKLAARQDLAGVVTLSARLSLMGLDAEPDLATIAEPKLFLSSQGDSAGAQAVTTLMATTTGSKDSQLYPGAGIGVALLEGASGADVRQRILQFLNQ